MPSIVLKVLGLPPDPAAHAPRPDPRWLFRGSGDIDYCCGNCGFAIAANMTLAQHVIVERAACSACGATNEFPRELRN